VTIEYRSFRNEIKTAEACETALSYLLFMFDNFVFIAPIPCNACTCMPFYSQSINQSFWGLGRLALPHADPSQNSCKPIWFWATALYAWKPRVNLMLNYHVAVFQAKLQFCC